MHPRRAFVTVSCTVLALVLARPVDAFRPVLHEKIPDDPREDLRLGATTPDGRLPAALDTRSGVVRVPEMGHDGARAPPPYAEPLAGGAGAAYEADRNTGKPSAVGYADPFTPTVTPYKRLRAFDDVGADDRLRVRDPVPVRQPVGGEPRADDDVFYGDFSVELLPGRSVRIPSVAPGQRVLKMSTVPAVPVELLRDGAENWYALSSRARGPVRLVLELVAPRAAFGGPLVLGGPDRTRPQPVPANVARDAATVVRAIGIPSDASRDEALGAMVAYFRSFAPSTEPPAALGGIYLDLALSKKGVCRHRAFAFTITALALGISARMVENEAHAWVEVRGERGFSRIDLGGAADLTSVASDDRPAHRPPADPFAWPASAERGAGAGAGEPASASAPATAEGSASARPAVRPAPEPSAPAPSPPEPASAPDVRIVVKSVDGEAKRGGPLRLEGRAERGAAPCARGRIVVSLSPRGGGQPVPLGSLATDARGEFRGSVYLPTRMNVGDYDVALSIGSCAPSE